MGRNVAFMIPSTTQIVSSFASGGQSINDSRGGTGTVSADSGSGTAGVLSTLLSVTGSGYMSFLSCASNSIAPTHTIRCQVIVDGATVFDATSDSIVASVTRGMVVINCIPQVGSTLPAIGTPIRFNASLEVKASSSESGVDYVRIYYQYDKT